MLKHTILSAFILAAPVAVFAQQVDTPSVYDYPTPPTEKEGVNLGGIKLNAETRYMTHYIYHGINITELLGDITQEDTNGGANFQFEGYLSFDLGKLPHPFIGIFTNVLDSDPVSNFEEVRPMIGLEWAARPFVFSTGANFFMYPDRSDAGTGEVWAKVQLDDAALLKRQKRLLSPYVLASYDYDAYKGLYLEFGVSHDFALEGTGITLTPLARVAYVMDHDQFVLPNTNKTDTGFQHYDIGLIAKYDLNTPLNIPLRYGKWSLNGYLYYTDGLDSDLRSATRLWGGVGFQITY